MEIDFDIKGKVLVVKPRVQRLDAPKALAFKEKMAEWVKKDHRLFVLDLSSVGFIDSSGLGAIISTLKLIGNSGNIVISGVNPPVMKLLKLTRLDKVFQVFDNQDDAVNSLVTG